MAPNGLLGRRVVHGSHDLVERLIRVALQRDHLLLVDHAATEAAVNGRLVHDERVLDIVAAVAHHGHDGVLAGRQLLKVY